MYKRKNRNPLFIIGRLLLVLRYKILSWFRIIPNIKTRFKRSSDGASAELKPSIFYFSLVLFFIISATACTEDFVPKPRGFQRIEMPKKEYQTYHADCGFSLEIPKYATMDNDRHPSAEKCWYNLSYMPFDATLHISYRPYHNQNELIKLTEDARTLVYKHTIKADEIYETQINNAYLFGMLYELSGNTATNFQFFVLDSTGNFIRGALYFNNKTNTDSIAPSLAFLKEEVLHSIESLRWN